MPSIKIISLPDNFYSQTRGWSFAPFKNSELIDSIEADWTTFHLVSVEPGTIRGNHFHPQGTEWLFFCGSPLLLVWQESDSEKINQQRITDRHTFAVIPPGIKHAIKNVGAEVLVLVAFRSPSPASGEAETLPSLLIE